MMKLFVFGLLVVGLIAALAATVLVSSLLARDTFQQAAVVVADGQILVAKQGLPAMSVIRAQDVTVQTIKQDKIPENAVTSSVQVVGKVLAVPVVEGQAFTQDLFADKGSGVHVAAALPEGMRAVTVSLSDYSGMEGLLYPGSVVDVLVSFRPPGEEGTLSQAIATTLLQGVQVLAVDNQTIMSTSTPETQVRSSVSHRLRVTLMVSSRQAKALQLAIAYGSVSLAMRNPLDESPADTDVTAIGDLASGIGPRLDNRDVMSMLQESENKMLSKLQEMFSARAQGTATAVTSGPSELDSSNSLFADSEEIPAVEYFVVTVIRGNETETLSFPIIGN